MDKLLMILQIIPALIKVIIAIEKALPVSGAGKEKLKLIETTMTDAYAGVTAMWPELVKVISGFVALANKFNVFNKDDEEATK